MSGIVSWFHSLAAVMLDASRVASRGPVGCWIACPLQAWTTCVRHQAGPASSKPDRHSPHCCWSRPA
eukprot:11490017-Alexandrium_andersonii.AAC.1